MVNVFGVRVRCFLGIFFCVVLYLGSFVAMKGGGGIYNLYMYNVFAVLQEARCVNVPSNQLIVQMW